MPCVRSAKKTLHHVTQGSRSQGQWRGSYSDSVVVPEENPCPRGPPRTNLQVPVLRFKSLKFLQTQYDNYDYDAPESR